MSIVKPKFISKDNAEFSKTLKKRVDDYFSQKGIHKKGNIRMYTKTVVLLLAYFIPFSLLFVDGLHTAVYFLLWALMGLAFSGAGFSIMHDAAHGAYSNNKRLNDILSYTMNLFGGNAYNWKVQHNVLHHTYTNVDHLDEDINPGVILRLSPHKKRYWIHRFQFLYAWFLYGLMTMMWSTVKDFRQLIRFNKNGLVAGKGKFRKEMTILIISKVLYFGYVIGLPMLLGPYSWKMVIAGVLLMHYVAGFVLTCVFQPAHVVEHTEYPLPDDNNIIDSKWEVHQLHTTVNFSQKSRLFSWYVGGLNYQIEHHLFPKICHVHYKELSKIVRKTANDYGINYMTSGSFLGALYSHGKKLKELGRA